MPGRTSLVKLSDQELTREVSRRRQRVKALTQKRIRLVARIAALDARIGHLSGSASRARNGQAGPRHATSLAETIIMVMGNKTMSVGEVIEAVRAAGYKTDAPSFRVMVNQKLSNRARFRRVGRGVYTVNLARLQEVRA